MKKNKGEKTNELPEMWNTNARRNLSGMRIPCEQNDEEAETQGSEEQEK